MTAADIPLAARENFRSREHLTRYTTLAMASDQGKTFNGSGILGAVLGKPMEAIGTTSGHAAAVTELFREGLQYDSTSLRVLVEDGTTCWAVANIVGPRVQTRHICSIV